MRKLRVIIALVLALGGASMTNTAQAKTSAALVNKIQEYQQGTWHRQKVMGVPKTPASDSYRTTHSKRYLMWVMKKWKRVNWRTIQEFKQVPYENEWYCIHRYEGSWQDPGAPYYGGLQMDLGFQRHYGAYLLEKKGTADHWTPLEQMWVAVRAHRSGRGFYPWPNTAATCGLL